MKIEEGKYYKDAKGRKVGPMRDDYGAWEYEGSNGGFRSDGASTEGKDPNLIEEWQDDPDEHDMPSDDALIAFNLRNAAVMLINAHRYEDAISIIYILKGDHE